MAEYLSPGVYVEEFDAGVKAMEGVGTGTAGFVGLAQKGPVRGMPVLITGMADYKRRFGGYLSERTYGNMRFLSYAVEQFFNNGGSSCYVMRVCAGGDEKNAAQKAKSFMTDSSGERMEDCHIIEAEAADPGEWGNSLHVDLTAVFKNRLQVTVTAEGKLQIADGDASAYREGDLICVRVIKTDKQQDDDSQNKCFYTRIKAVEDKLIEPEDALSLDEKTSYFMYLTEWNAAVGDDTAAEQYESVSLNPARSNYAEHMLEKSQLITMGVNAEEVKADVLTKLLGDAEEPVISLSFEGGTDGVISEKAEERAGMYLGDDGSPDQRTGLMAFKTVSDVSIMAIPGITDESVQSALVSHCESMGNRFAVLDMPADLKDVGELQEFRENVDSSYAAMYHPWLQCYDPLDNRNVYLPPSGSVAGIYGRTDAARGVHKAPANEIVRNCTGLSVKYNDAEQAKLNPKGINLIRRLPGQGIRVWGARTCSSDGNWKYVNVRRLFIFIEESIRVNTNWAVFEPNDEILWSRVEGTIRVFLTTQWRNGALAGSTAEEAFFINIGKSTMTEDDILNGRLICVIGVAPVRPAEFVVFRITQKMESAQ
ncbi:MAG: phage tail sheath family protein [Clostridium sp.]|nr:phage tail sheath family protein [Acetatifactor muris]MCM1527180.1 phage tail sheath family protein [Bacteroides sp.]MCM1562495.1 phage tail sheath family protein [Clostridium sp.]